MKGCPLKCLWCSSPQTQKGSFELIHIEVNCRMCGRCVEVCPHDAITLSDGEGWKTGDRLGAIRQDCQRQPVLQAVKRRCHILSTNLHDAWSNFSKMFDPIATIRFCAKTQPNLRMFFQQRHLSVAFETIRLDQ